KIKVPCSDDKKKALSDFFSARVSDLETDNTDGIKVLFEDGWVLMRPSGTEPAYRIFSESRSETTARSRAEEYAGMAEEFLSEKFSS
ncbi:MAG: phosphoglucosamine mutase, partial [Candidatus Methanomethylophilaceae archaeon]|nr:phosphoglucosamine mutase [Candidatus Methanomethylophilaceae archaeon]